MVDVRPKASLLTEDVAERIELWVQGVEQAEIFGLWLHGAPRAGTSFAARAALNQLGKIPKYNHQDAYVLDTYGAYQSLRKIWDTNHLMRGNTSDAGLVSEVFELEDEVEWEWGQNVLLLDDWNDTVPVDFFLKHFYPHLRMRISKHQPTVIATRYPPDIAGIEAAYFAETFVVAEVLRAGR